MTDRTVRAVITGSSAGAVRAFEEASLASQKSGDEISGKFGKLGKLISNPYVDAAVAAGAAAITIGTAAVDMASKYQDATDAMAARAGITQSAATKIGSAFLDTAFKSTFSAQQMMEAYGPVAGQLGITQGHALSAAEAIQVMSAANDLAEASGQDLSSTTANLATVMQLYGIQASGAAAASDVLFNTSRLTGVSTDSMTQAFQRLHSQLGANTPPLDQVGGLLVDLAQHGETGRQGLSALSTAFQGLVSPTKAVQKAQEDLGVSFKNAQTGAFLPMQQIIGELQPKLAGMGDAQATAELKSLGFGSAAAKLLDIIRAGPEVFAADTDAVGKAGSAHAAAQTATDNLKGAFDRAKAGVNDFMVRIGTALLPVITTLVNFFSNNILPALNAFWNTIQQHMPQIQAGFQTFGTVVTTTFTVVKNILVTTFSVLYTVISSVIERIVAIIQVIVTVVQAVMTVIVPVVTTAFSVIRDVVTVAVGIVEGIIAGIGLAFTVVSSVISTVVGTIVTIIGTITTAIQGVIGWISGALTAVFSSIETFGQIVFGGIATAVGWVVNAIETVIGWIQTAIGWLARLFQSASTTTAQNLYSQMKSQGASQTALNAFAQSAGIAPHASGGVIAPGTFGIVNDAGPELMYGGSSGISVLPAGPTAAALGGGGGGTVVNITVNGGDPQAVVNALRRYMQLNGSIPISVRAA